jgi:lipopolysaccharide cholinephosphotransferase
MEEKWKEIYSEDEIRSIQRIELNSLKVFIEICKKLEIDFMLYGGTLLGAVKYKGFVPWDDDLDIALMRIDYDKLIEFGPALLPKEYEIQHPSINKVTPFSYIKFRRKDTMLVDYSSYKLKMNHGIYFDIYPIDNIPDDDRLMYKQHKEFSSLAKMFYFRQIKNVSHSINNMKDIVKALAKGVIYLILRCIPHKYFVNRMYKTMTRYNYMSTKRQGNYFYSKPVNYFNGIYPLVEVSFEGLDLKIPQGYEINLFNRYGDISKLPPEEERFGHKAYILKL